MNGWRRAAACAFLAVVALVVLGFCLHNVFNYLISASTPNFLPTENTFAYLWLSALPWYFWTEICFIVASMGAGLYMGSHITLKKRSVKKRWKNIVRIFVYIFGLAFLLAFFFLSQNVTFFFLSANIPYPPIAGQGTTSIENALDNFFVGVCAPVLFCFVVASVGAGLCIGAHARDRDEKAWGLLLFGLVCGVVLFLIGWVWITSLIH